MTMNPELLFIDIDGTLFDHEKDGTMSRKRTHKIDKF